MLWIFYVNVTCSQCPWPTPPVSANPKKHNGPSHDMDSSGPCGHLSFIPRPLSPWGIHCMISAVGSQHWAIVGCAQGPPLGFRGQSGMTLGPLLKFKDLQAPPCHSHAQQRSRGQNLGSHLHALSPVPSFLPYLVILVMPPRGLQCDLRNP